MKIYKHFRDLKIELSHQKTLGKVIGFAPTMGALHEGHLSLIEQSKNRMDITVSSIFVNPEQFNNPEDFLKYPITLETDILYLEEHDCDYLFLPDVKEIYPDEKSKNRHFELGYLENILEGKFRPGHFQGVCLIVERLLSEILPDYVFIGQKDFQQCMVIKKLIDLMNIKTEIVVCPTLRENSGLAMSSRNLRLNNVERELAPALFQSLNFIKEHIKEKSFSMLKEDRIRHLEDSGFKVDYLELALRGNLEITEEYDPSKSYVLLIAAYLNEIRLIDNLIF